MFEDLQFKGEWWLPEHYEQRVQGEFKFNKEEGGLLEINGSIDGKFDFGTFAPEIILGSANGQNITLLNCYQKGRSRSFPGIQISTFTVQLIFIGYHFSKKEEISFTKMNVYYSNLNEWTGISGILPDDDNDDYDLEIKYKQPKSIILDISDNLEIYFNSRLKPNYDKNKVEMIENAFMGINFKEERLFDDYRKIIANVGNFLSVATGILVHPLEIEGEIKSRRIDGELDYVKIYGYSLDEVNKSLTKERMLFSLNDNWVLSNLEQLLSKWLEMAEYLESTYQLYFTTIYYRPAHLNQWFLPLAQAIESYYKHSKQDYNGYYVADNKLYKKLVYKPIKNYIQKDEEFNGLLNQIDENDVNDLKKSLEERIRHGNEPYLKTKIKEIFDENEEYINDIIDDKEGFIEKFKCTRDYLTHYSINLKECSANDKEIFEMCNKLQIIIERLFLIEIGFTSKIIKDVIKSQRHQRQIIEYAP